MLSISETQGKSSFSNALKGVFSDQLTMCGIVAFWYGIRTSFSFFHNFLYFFQGKHSIHIFGSQRLLQYNLHSRVPALSYSCGLGMWKLWPWDVNVVFYRCETSGKKMWFSVLEWLPTENKDIFSDMNMSVIVFIKSKCNTYQIFILH